MQHKHTFDTHRNMNMWRSVSFCFLFWLAQKVIGSESIEGIDQGTQITRFLEGYREGRTLEKKIGGPSLIGYINSLIGIRTVYIIVFIVAVMMIIQTINKEEPLTVGRGEARTDHGSSSSFPDESTEVYQSRDKED